jgi:histidyl-tRNA synthetase
MAKEKPGIPQGTRDFGPGEVKKREFIFTTIKRNFELYGFQPLETPAMENLDTLMGKYGEEGDKLIFKILNNGLSDPKNIEKARAAFENVLQGKNDKNLTERALKYDLTIPFARYVAMNHGQLVFPFKRYQMQPVWRADRPGRGRYREFYQCDADVVGSYSLMNEVDLVYIYHNALTQLGLKGYELRINNRKILTALADLCGGADKMKHIAVAIDKLDKIGLEKVGEELQQRGLSAEQIGTINQYLHIDGSNEEKLAQIRKLIGHLDSGQKGMEEIEYVLGNSQNNGYVVDRPQIVIDFTLARGLDYYTGIIFEARAPREVKIGSIGGGGRYDDLTGLFGVPGVPGVGVSFGVDRIYDVMEELNLFPAEVHSGTQLLFFNMGEAESKKAYEMAQLLRKKGIRCELFHEAVKMDKQFKFAERKQIPYVAILGSKELQDGTCVIKDIRSGEQKTLTLSELTEYFPEQTN